MGSFRIIIPQENDSTPILTITGLILSLVVPVLYSLAFRPTFLSGQVSRDLEIVIGLAVMWMAAFCVILLVYGGEKRKLRSIGLTGPSKKIVSQALGLGVLLSLAVPLLSVLAGTLLPSKPTGSIEAATQIPWWLMLLSVLTAGVTEEILFRGYPLERLFEMTGSKLFSSFISLAFFTAIHAAAWNLAHLVGVVMPLGVILIILYWWRRNVIMVMIVHVIVNLPLVFMAFGNET